MYDLLDVRKSLYTCVHVDIVEMNDNPKSNQIYSSCV